MESFKGDDLKEWLLDFIASQMPSLSSSTSHAWDGDHRFLASSSGASVYTLRCSSQGAPGVALVVYIDCDDFVDLAVPAIPSLLFS